MATVGVVMDLNYLNVLLLGSNETWRVGLFVIVLFSALISGRVLRFFLTRAGERMRLRDLRTTSVVVTSLARSAPLCLLVVGFKIGSSCLIIPEGFERYIEPILSAALISSIAYILYTLIDVVELWLRSFADRTESTLDDMLLPLVRKSLRVTIVVLALLQIATVFSDKPLTSVLAGLGVGGLAVALAAQETIKNFFGSLVIFGDKPFELGDRIVVDGHDGPVEEVGFRSTRLRTLDGHLVTIPNGELANKMIQNISKRPNIKHSFTIGLVYETTHEQVRQAVQIVKELLDNHEGIDEEFPPRVYFDSMGDFSLNIKVLFWYHPADYWAFKAFNEQLLLSIMEKYAAAGLDFAFPSQTLYLKENAQE